jgi:hypothetical protein
VTGSHAAMIPSRPVVTTGRPLEAHTMALTASP